MQLEMHVENPKGTHLETPSETAIGNMQTTHLEIHLETCLESPYITNHNQAHPKTNVKHMAHVYYYMHAHGALRSASSCCWPPVSSPLRMPPAHACADAHP